MRSFGCYAMLYVVVYIGVDRSKTRKEQNVHMKIEIRQINDRKELAQSRTSSIIMGKIKIQLHELWKDRCSKVVSIKRNDCLMD